MLITSFHPASDFSEESLTSLKAALANDGFVTYETTVGGSGFGLFASPPTSSTVSAEGGAEAATVPSVAQFREVNPADLAAHFAGASWVFV